MMADRIDQHGEVETAVVELALELVAHRDDIFGLEQRIVVAHDLQQLGQAGDRKAVRETDADAAADRRRIALQADAVSLLEQRPRARNERDALGGQRQSSAVLLKQLDPEGPLKVAQAQRDRRLRQMKMPGRLAERAQLRRPEERLELRNREAHPSGFQMYSARINQLVLNCKRQ
jgi:hypothetical protein